MIDVPFLVVKMTDGLKDSISSSLTSALLMEAVSFAFGNVACSRLSIGGSERNQRRAKTKGLEQAIGNAETQITTRPGRSC